MTKMGNNVAAVILAAGLGKRMKSDLPKVLHKVAGKCLVEHVLESVVRAGIENIVLVVGHKYELVQKQLAGRGLKFAIQQPQLGTGHAVQMALPMLGDFTGDLLILNGDMPLVTSKTIDDLVATRCRTGSAATVLTAILEDPASYGRIVRDREGFLEAIVEFRDADDRIKSIKEVNTGAFCFDFNELVPCLKRLKTDNVQAEYYITDVISLMREQGLKVSALISDDPKQGLGVNSLAELAGMELLFREQIK